MLAQPTFQAQDLVPTIGSTDSWRNTDYHAPGPATYGFVYDISNLVLGAADSSRTVDPASTPYAANFPNASYTVFGLSYPEQYDYYQVNTTQELYLGVQTPTLSITMTDPMQTKKFPLALGTSWSDAHAEVLSVDGTITQRHGTSSGNYNGFGTVILPYGTFTNVARVERTETYFDASSGNLLNAVHSVSYFAQGYRSPLFITTSFIDGFLGDTTYLASVLDPDMVGIGENVNVINAVLAPNPTTDITYVAFSAAPAPNMQICVLDATGLVIRIIQPTMGARRFAIDMAGMASGLYFVRATENSGATGSWPLIVK